MGEPDLRVVALALADRQQARLGACEPINQPGNLAPIRNMGGHSGCGGVAALSAQLDMDAEPHLARWVELARPAVARVAADAVPEAERANALVQANVLLQCEHLRTYPCVAAALTAGTLRIYGAFYTLHSGEVLIYSDRRQAWVALPPAVEEGG